MRSLSRDKKEKVNQFRAVVQQANEKIAIDCLRQSGWSIERAVDHFYDEYAGSIPAAVPGQGSTDSLFNKYKDQQQGVILAAGVQQFCDDLGVEPTDVVMVVISWYMEAKTMCEYDKEEFTKGLLRLHCSTIDQLKSKLSSLRAQLSDKQKFQDIYNFSYRWACEKGQKCLQLETAIAMWQLLLAEENAWWALDDWIEFLQATHQNRAIIRDTWIQLLEFIDKSKYDREFSFYDDQGAWPTLIDDFVDHMTKKKVQ